MRPVIVVGPHRSGTSVTTRVISLLGLSLCVEEDRLVKWDNPTGHWESKTLTDLNDELLGRFQGIWYAPPKLPAEWWSSPDLETFRQRAVEEFHRVHRAADWVWKDPRLCLTLPFWISALGVDPVIVLTVRHPLEAADSLVARDGWGPRHALALWEWYVASMLRNVAGRAVAVVHYRSLLDNAVREVSRLRDDLASLGVVVPAGGVPEAAAFVEQKRCHHRHDQARSALTAAQQDLHRLLAGLDSGYDAFPELELPRLTPSTVELVAVHRRLRQLQIEFEERTQWALSLERELAERNEAIHQLQAEFEERTQWALKMKQELAEREATIRRLQAEQAK